MVNDGTIPYEFMIKNQGQQTMSPEMLELDMVVMRNISDFFSGELFKRLGMTDGSKRIEWWEEDDIE